MTFDNRRDEPEDGPAAGQPRSPDPQDAGPRAQPRLGGIEANPAPLKGVLEVNQGSLYPALYRLRDRGLIESEWGETEEGRRVKVYHLTRRGVARLEQEQEAWRLFSGAVDAILATG
jgi:hypothetical protein